VIRQYVIIFIGVVSVSFAAIFIRLAEAPPLIIGSYRLLIASLIIWPLTLKYSRNELRHLTLRDLRLALISGAFLGLHFGLWISSLSYTSVATSVILATSSPLFVAIASYVFFKEKISWEIITGIVVCFFGAAFICYGNWGIGSDSFFGGILALLGALAASGYMLFGRRLRQTIGLLVYSAITCSSAGLLLLITSLILRYPLFGYTGTTYLMMILLAVVPQMLGHLSLNWSLRFVSATLVTIAVLGEPVGANIWAFLILGEKPQLFEIIGSVLILAGIFTAFRRSW
jgi:drug/metabolite transporter (DMT)-like permease